MRINKMISKGKMPQSLDKFSPLIVQEIYADQQHGEFVYYVDIVARVNKLPISFTTTSFPGEADNLLL